MKKGDDEAVSIRAVATAVGVTPPAIYLHFADKDELLLAVCELQFRHFDDYVERAIVGLTDPVDRLLARGKAYVQFGIEHPEHYRILFMSRAASVAVAAVDDQAAMEATGFGHLLANVQDCIDAGSIAEPDPLVVATGLWALVHGVTSLAISIPGFPHVGMERLMKHVTDVIKRGLAPPD